ncbi:MAG: hypothetical protein Q8W45_01245 [Candidatus Palauibacterales bacterium]|nr:hypothetical protein [Candidatus Palauibacterales bacterium]MDP2481880.1 hypothetical protein [Candidatus Palauibacterales bacterium]
MVAAFGAALAVILAGSCDGNDPIYGVSGESESAGDTLFSALSGNFQNGRTSEAFPEPLVVQVLQDLGLVDGVQNTVNIQPVENLEIGWAITGGVATLSSPVAFTDSTGQASVVVTSGPLLGDIEVTATIGGQDGPMRVFDLRTSVYLIEILFDGFEVPLGGDSIEVVIGDTIEWVNRDALSHAVRSTSVPDGVSGFASGDLRNSHRYRLVPKVEGLYDYDDPLSAWVPAPTGRISVVGRGVGGLRTVTSTTGTNIDPAYVVTIDATRSSAIGPEDEITFPALPATPHVVRLVEVQPNCTVAGDNPRSVTVVAADTVSTTFQVTCE